MVSTRHISYSRRYNQFIGGNNKQLISPNESIHWAFDSCDLMFLNYLLWGYVKSPKNQDKKEHLKANIRSVIACLVRFTGKSVWKLTLQVHLVFQLKIPRLYLALYERFEFCTMNHEEKVNWTFPKSGWTK